MEGRFLKNRLINSLLLLGAGWIFCLPASASTLDFDSQFSSSNVSLGLGFTTPLAKSGERAKTTLAANYDYSKNRNSTVEDITHDFGLGLSRKTDSRVDFGGGVSYSTTPAENLSNFGPNGKIGYSYEWGESEDFNPSIGGNFQLGFLRYQQSVTTTSTTLSGRKNRTPLTSTTTNTVSIGQVSLGISTYFSLWEWVTFRIGYTKYNYTRNIKDFEAQLDSPLAARSGASSFLSTVSGFPKSSTRFGFSLYPSKDWEVEVSYSATKIASDNSTSTTTKLIVDKDLNDEWRIGLGVGRSKSASTNEGLFLFSLSRYF